MWYMLDNFWHVVQLIQQYLIVRRLLQEIVRVIRLVVVEMVSCCRKVIRQMVVTILETAPVLLR